MKPPSDDTVSGVMEFLASYRKAFENFDTETILDHYVFPCTIVSDAWSTEVVVGSVFDVPQRQQHHGER